MARVIEQGGTEQATESDLAELMGKIETMSDQEVRDRLAQEKHGNAAADNPLRDRFQV